MHTLAVKGTDLVLKHGFVNEKVQREIRHIAFTKIILMLPLTPTNEPRSRTISPSTKSNSTS